MILQESCSQEIKVFRENCLQKNHFLGVFTPQKRQGWHFRFFLKTMVSKKKFLEKKKHYWNNFYEMIQILNQSAYNASDFEMKLFLH